MDKEDYAHNTRRSVEFLTEKIQCSLARAGWDNISMDGQGFVEIDRILDELEIFWPTSNTTQTFRNLRSNQSIQIIEGEKSYKTINEPLFSYDVYLEN